MFTFGRNDPPVYPEKIDIMVRSQERLNALYYDLKYHMKMIGAMAAEAGNQNISEYLETMETEVSSNIYHPYAAFFFAGRTDLEGTSPFLQSPRMMLRVRYILMGIAGEVLINRRKAVIERFRIDTTSQE